MPALRTSISFCLSALATAWGQDTTAPPPVRSVTDPGVVTTRQAITPAGVPAVFQGRVYGVTFGASDSELFVLTATQVYKMDWRANKVLGSVAHQGSPGLQGIRYDSASGKALVSGVDRARKTKLFATTGDSATPVFTGEGTMIAGGLAVAPGKRAIVPMIRDNKLAVAELDGTGRVRSLPTAIAPFAAAIDKEGAIAWVTNWGGRLPTAKDLTLPTGLAPDADKVVVDGRGIAATGSVTRIDLNSGASAQIATGLHPTGLAWDEPRQRLYVANSNSDTVTVIDTSKNTVIRTIDIQPFGQRVAGIAPAAIAVSPDGAKVWVACGGINAVVQVRAGDGKMEGMIPTGWYPNAIALSPDGKLLAVSTLLGPGSGWRDEPSKRFVHSYRGSVHVVPVPTAGELASYTTVSAENNRMSLSGSGGVQQAPRAVPPVPVPERAGEPSAIEHVVYIIKENRTYDQVFGDMPKGNGDPSLVMFGEDVTPNQHALAGKYVLLDNFYASGGNSADGHQWLTQANETAYCLWPGYAGRSYPFDGTDPIAYASKGFLWDYALARKKTVRVYGEYAGRMSETDAAARLGLIKEWDQGNADFTKRWTTKAPLEPLNRILAASFPAYTNAIPDVVRASIFNADVAKWERDGNMPNLVIVQLPSDHTFGTRPGVSSPKAMVADNDLAVGQVVEALTRTRFWKKMAIFVVEDDAQNGVDHVDGHRTVALVVSPFARRGWVDSTFYSNQSMLKTIELILGLPTMSLFDLIAHDMRASFTADPDLSTYTAIRPKQDLYEVNPPLTALRGEQRRAAIASARMRWDVPDAVPSDRLNRILWHATRGWSAPYPGTRQAVFAPLSNDVDDDDRE